MTDFSPNNLDLPESVQALVQSVVRHLHSDIEVQRNEYKAETPEQKKAFKGTLASLFAITMTAPDFFHAVSALLASDLPLPIAENKESEFFRLLVQRHCPKTETVCKDGGVYFTTDVEAEAEKIETYAGVINSMKKHDPEVLEALMTVVGVKVNE